MRKSTDSLFAFMLPSSLLATTVVGCAMPDSTATSRAVLAGSGDGQVLDRGLASAGERGDDPPATPPQPTPPTPPKPADAPSPASQQEPAGDNRPVLVLLDVPPKAGSDGSRGLWLHQIKTFAGAYRIVKMPLPRSFARGGKEANRNLAKIITESLDRRGVDRFGLAGIVRKW